ncbi:NAD(P)/FAD-dependent oxidoreductase [Streptomyces sp. AP-93]|uniref:FAD-dependent oxidoreductase n=1 Tax=Streptomyces sp. AP-93 TaxID=2929048 RepID=UPI001FAF179F|nr:FAD-dependent monooxygenase [Streptomyces sp. AP-93]MCJ0873811.1 FAD-dependent monooxygenase [Streptomyces sp. AP-93]
MTAKSYDAVIVGARCAGASTAMLLARQGYRVLVVDRAAFPSDTLSTHLIHPPGLAALRRWGLLDRVIGADGAHSMVARAVDAPRYAEKPKLQVSYYTYWANLPMHGGFEAYMRGDRAFAAWPTT